MEKLQAKFRADAEHNEVTMFVGDECAGWIRQTADGNIEVTLWAKYFNVTTIYSKEV